MNASLRLAIELGDFSLSSVTPLTDIIWFLAGLLLLVGLTAATLWWHRRARPDPFEIHS
ncbi:MAG: hypothetical protein KDE51_05325 [Anaerolineales bacterium]|nr:hypothetical protein [Anaerolineales bacterium]